MSHEQPSGHEQPRGGASGPARGGAAAHHGPRRAAPDRRQPLVNLGGQRLGLAPGAEDMRDLDRRASRSRGCAPCCRWSRSRTPSRCARPRRALAAPARLCPARRGRTDAEPGAAGPQRPEQEPPGPRQGRGGPPPAPAGCGCLRAAAADRDQRGSPSGGYRDRPIHCGSFWGLFGSSAASLPPAAAVSRCAAT